MQIEKKVFAHAWLLPSDLCRERCKAVKFTAVSDEGKAFRYAPDPQDYQDDADVMWSTFRSFCKSCGVGGRGEVWAAFSYVKEGAAYARCVPCGSENCFNLLDYLKYLADWETVFVQEEYNFKNFMQRPRISFEQFCAEIGRPVLRDAFDGLAVYRAFKEHIDKDLFSAEECRELAKFVQNNADGIYGGSSTRAWFDMQIYITNALLWLARSDKNMMAEVLDGLCDHCRARGGSAEKCFYRFLQDVSYEREIREGVYSDPGLADFLYTKKMARGSEALGKNISKWTGEIFLNNGKQTSDVPKSGHPMSYYRDTRREDMAYVKGYPCPVCGRTVFWDDYEICPVCGWENDGGEFDPTRAYGANGCSFYEYRRRFRQNMLADPLYTWRGECDEHKEKKGIFWIVDREDLKNNAPYLFRIPVDIEGNPSALTSILPLNSKRGDNYNHKLTWECYLPRALRRGKPYYYYPRGRVEIDDRTRAKIYLHPDLVTEPVIAYLIEKFRLQKREVIVNADGSKHYSYLAKVKEDMEEEKSAEETLAKKIFKGQKEAVLFRAAEIGEASRDVFRDLRLEMRKHGGEYCAFRALWGIGETGWTEDFLVSFGVRGRAALRLAEQCGHPFVTFKEGEACEEYFALPLREQGRQHYGGERVRIFPLQEGDAVLRPLHFGQQGEEAQLVSLWQIEYPRASCYHAVAGSRFHPVFSEQKEAASLTPAFPGAIQTPAER